jgi:hypothetical protein
MTTTTTTQEFKMGIFPNIRHNFMDHNLLCVAPRNSNVNNLKSSTKIQELLQGNVNVYSSLDATEDVNVVVQSGNGYVI